MIPKGVDAISPAPHHDIYSIEDLRQLIYSLKEATAYTKPVIVKVAAVHNVCGHSLGHCAQRRGHHCHRRLPRRHGRGSHQDTRQRGHSHRTRARTGGRTSPPGGHTRQRFRRCRRLHTFQLGCGKGHSARRGRLLHSYRGGNGARLSPLPQLPRGQVQLGHSIPSVPTS